MTTLKFFSRFVSIFVLATLAFTLPVLAQPGKNAKTHGLGVHVGAFRLHVEIQQQRVMITPRNGAVGAAFPATQLETAFVSWDAATGTTIITVAVLNGGGINLAGPIEARISQLASPMTVALNPDGGSGPGSWHWKYGPDQLGGAILAPAFKSNGRQWQFRSVPGNAFQADVDIFAGVPLQAGEGATIVGVGGATVTVPPNSIPYEAVVDIALLPLSSLQAPAGNLPVAGVVKLTLEPTRSVFMPATPHQPLKVSIPATGNMTSNSFVVAQELLVADGLSDPPGIFNRLVFTETASRQASDIVTNSIGDPGIRMAGVYAFLANTGSGFVKGVVFDSGGLRAGALVGSNKNPLVSVTNALGRYHLFISGDGPFTVTAFDPFAGSEGAASGTISVSGATVTASISLTVQRSRASALVGIRNSGFELGNLEGWVTSGSAIAQKKREPTSTGDVIQPTEGDWMAAISTGPGAVGSIGSSLRQRFHVPAGAGTLRLDYNFVSEEFPEFLGTIFDDSFRALITTPDGQITFAQVSVNRSGGFKLIGDCFLPGGDNTCGMTGWREATVDLSRWAGTGSIIDVELLFSAIDAGDSVYDTLVLIDNIRFSTVWVNANFVNGAIAKDADKRVRSEISAANKILSQAGINVRLRSSQVVPDPGGLLVDLDIVSNLTCNNDKTNCGYNLTREVQQLLAESRSATLADVNVYYVQAFSMGEVTPVKPFACGVAFGPDDYRDGSSSRLDLLTRGGAALMNTDPIGCTDGGHSLAHELGHLLLSPMNAGDALEHSAGANNFMGGQGGGPPLGIISPQQSRNINRVGAPLLAP